MNRTAMALVLCALAAGACGDPKNEGAPSASNTAKSTSAASGEDKEKPPVDKGKDGKENVELAEAYAKAVCQCKDAQCINKAGDDYQAATDKMYSDKQARNPTPEQEKQMKDASGRVKECTDKLLKGK
jgi:hypothetical protein